MKFDNLNERVTSRQTEDGITIEYQSKFWYKFKYNRIKWNSKQEFIPIDFPYVHEEQIHRNENGSSYPYLIANKNAPIPTLEQKIAYEYFVANEITLGNTFVDRIFEEYNRLRIEYNEPDDSSLIPRLKSSEELVDYIELTQIYILPNNENNQSFIGFYFGGCSWDDEHGLGLLTWKDKVLKVGQIEDASDLAFKI